MLHVSGDMSNAVPMLLACRKHQTDEAESANLTGFSNYGTDGTTAVRGPNLATEHEETGHHRIDETAVERSNRILDCKPPMEATLGR